MLAYATLLAACSYAVDDVSAGDPHQPTPPHVGFSTDLQGEKNHAINDPLAQKYSYPPDHNEANYPQSEDIDKDINHFGKSGQIYVQGRSQSSLSGQLIQSNNVSTNNLSFNVSANISSFANDYLSFGGAFTFSASGANDQTLVNLGLGPQIAGRLPVGSESSWLPTLSFIFDLAHSSTQAASQTGTGLVLTLDMPFIVELGQGFAMSVGPALSFGVAGVAAPNGSQTVTSVNYGLGLGFLGWR